jgi:hypothetical protein
MRKDYAAGVSIAKIAMTYGVDWSSAWRHDFSTRPL